MITFALVKSKNVRQPWGLTRTFDFFAKLNKLKQVVRRRCFVTRLHSVANFCNKSQVTQFQNVWKTVL